MDKVAVIRSVHHSATLHDSASIHALTGRPLERADRELFEPIPQFYPSYGGAVAYMKPQAASHVPYAALPFVFQNVVPTPCQGGGILGNTWDPLRIDVDPIAKRYLTDALGLRDGMNLERMAGPDAHAEGTQEQPAAVCGCKRPIGHAALGDVPAATKALAPRTAGRKRKRDRSGPVTRMSEAAPRKSAIGGRIMCEHGAARRGPAAVAGPAIITGDGGQGRHERRGYCGHSGHEHHGGHDGCCQRGGEGTRGHPGFARHFQTRAERLERLEAYLKALQAEVEAVQEHIAELSSREAVARTGSGSPLGAAVRSCAGMNCVMGEQTNTDRLFDKLRRSKSGSLILNLARVRIATGIKTAFTTRFGGNVAGSKLAQRHSARQG